MIKHISIPFLLCLFGFCATAQAQTEILKGLKILSQPSPEYTDRAGMNNIRGTVQVRVTFPANGRIGKVGDVRENHEDLRKFGLVKVAMKAAKKIKFEPAAKNGKPVEASGIVEYKFTLF